MNELFTGDQPAVVSSERILYTPSAFARSALLHLQEIGSLSALSSHTSQRSGLNSYLFFTVVSGSGKLEYNGRSYDLPHGSCVFIDCELPYSHTTNPDDLWSLKWVHFSGPSMASVYAKYIERGGQPVFSLKPEGEDSLCEGGDKNKTGIGAGNDKLETGSRAGTVSEFGRISTLWSSLMAAAGSDDYMRDMKINELLSGLILCIMEQSWHPEERRKAPKRASVREVKEYLDTNYRERITLDDLSRIHFIDKYYLAKSFRAEYGQTITAYINNLRITKAKQLLRFTDKTVEEIGEEVGIDNPAYFSRIFKEIEGVGPKKYREQW